MDGDWGVFFYSAKSNHWTQVATTNGVGDPSLRRLKMGPYSNFASYSPSAKAIVFGGGGATKIYKFDAAGRIYKLGDAPITLGIASSIITVDPVSGKHLVLGKDRSFWEYDTQTDTWHPLKVSTVPLFEPPVPPAVFDIVAAPVSTYGVVMFVKYSPGQSKVYLYKHSTSALASHQ